MSTHKKFAELHKALSAALVDRHEEISCMLVALVANEHFLMVGPPGCIDGDTVISYRRGVRNSSRSLTLRELYYKFNGLLIPGARRGKSTPWRSDCPTYLHSYDFDSGRVFYNRIVSVLDSGVKKCVSVKMSDGVSVVMTGDHPVLTLDGFVHAEDLQPEDLVVCRGNMKPSKSHVVVPRSDRVVVSALKYYSSGWDGSVKDQNTGKVFHYKRQHRARLVVEADMNGLSYDEYIYRLKNDPDAISLKVLSRDVDVHHRNGNPTDDRLLNLEPLGRADHIRSHDPVSQFNIQYISTLRVVSISGAGERHTYDVQMESPSNNFAVANGLIVHNTAKSLLCDGLTKAVDGAQSFQRLLGKYSEPAELFGPISLKALKEDRMEHVTDGFLPEADIAFVDEIGKAGPAIINSLLTMMNERRFDNGPTRIDCPLKILVAASNEWPVGEGFETCGAMFDRFLIRKSIDYVSPSSLGDVTWGELPEVPVCLTLEDLDTAHAEAKAVTWSEAGKRAYLEILDRLRREGIRPSDRRVRKCAGIAQAAAWLAGSKEVKPQHLEVLQHCLWEDPIEHPQKTAEVVIDVANPGASQLPQLMVEAKELLDRINVRAVEETTYADLAKLKEVHRKISSLPGDRASKSAADVGKKLKSLTAELMGVGA